MCIVYTNINSVPFGNRTFWEMLILLFPTIKILPGISTLTTYGTIKRKNNLPKGPSK